MTTRGERQTPGGNEFGADQPSWALTEKTRSWTVRTGNNSNVSGRGPDDLERYERTAAAPAPTLDTNVGSKWTLHTNRGQDGGGRQVADPEARPAPAFTSKSGGQWSLRSDARVNACVRPAPAPAPALLASMDNGDCRWVYERPSTAVVGDPRLSGPGYRGGRADYELGIEPLSRQDSAGTIKITVPEAAVLQGFDREYPFRGTRTAQFRQVGDAIPPPMAEAILRELAPQRVDVDAGPAA